MAVPSKSKILIIGSPSGLVQDQLWAQFSMRYDICYYEFPTTNDFYRSMKEGAACGDIVAIVRLGLNIPPGIEKVGQGWTKRGLPHFAKSLRLIVSFGHGYDEEDVPALREAGIEFLNTTGGSEATAVIGIFLIISVFRNLSLYERMLRNDEFLPALRDSARNASDPFGKKLGIVGMGSIGQRIARQAADMGLEIHCLKRPTLQDLLSKGDHSLPKITLHQGLESLVGTVDCITLACSYSPATHHLLSRDIFSVMKRGMRIVNIARGKCIDEEAMIEAIENGTVRGVGLDVYYDE